MAGAFGGGWSRRTQAPIDVPIHAPIDPEHLTPTDNPEYVETPPLWMDSTNAPVLPFEVMPGAPPELINGFGPVDRTPDLGSSYGVGVGPGLTVLESQDKMRPWHNDDQGAVAAHQWSPMVDRDGTPTLDVIPKTDGAGDSPATVQLQRTGVGQPNDPNAQLVHGRQKRSYRRWIDRHMWAVQQRPMATTYSTPTAAQPPTPGGTQYDSPYPTAVTFYGGPADRFVTPQVRTAPGNWAVASTTNGSDNAEAGATAGYGLPTWGL